VTYPQIYESRAKRFRQEIGFDAEPDSNPVHPVASQLDGLNRRFQDQLDQLQSRLKDTGEKILQEDDGESHPDVKVTETGSVRLFVDFFKLAHRTIIL
jgi:hypothetical protein